MLPLAERLVTPLLGRGGLRMGSGSAGEVYEGSLPEGLANLFRQLDGSKSLSMEIRTVRAQYVAALRDGDGMAQEWCLEMLIKLVKADPGVDSSSFNTWTAEVGREIAARQSTKPPPPPRLTAPVDEERGLPLASRSWFPSEVVRSASRCRRERLPPSGSGSRAIP